MKNLRGRYVIAALALGVSLLAGLAAWGNTASWQEEVKLLDGRVITVTQKRRFEGVYTGQNFGRIPREAWVTFKLPEFGNQEIVWHESLDTQVLNVYQGKLYLVGFPHTEREFQRYGGPQPPYVGSRYENGRWIRIRFDEIPAAIYDSNMWIDNEPHSGAKFVSLSDKKKQIEDGSYPKDLKRIDPAKTH